MAKTHYVNCPFCEGLLEVEAESGELVGKWAKGERHASADDKMSSALKKLQEAKEKRATLFDKTKGALEGQKKRIEESFREEVERAKKEGPGKKPFRPFDLD